MPWTAWGAAAADVQQKKGGLRHHTKGGIGSCTKRAATIEQGWGHVHTQLLSLSANQCNTNQVKCTSRQLDSRQIRVLMTNCLPVGLHAPASSWSHVMKESLHKEQFRVLMKSSSCASAQAVRQCSVDATKAVTEAFVHSPSEHPCTAAGLIMRTL
eukprot:1141202-Pelagomonas_calceolata.AAC.1